jgi:NhaP-type Na+/H+ or K+/H+ antiporter
MRPAAASGSHGRGRIVTTDEILAGLGLMVALAVGSQILANRLRIPAIVVLLPVGFTAGAITDNVVPTNLVGSAFGPLVSLAVAVILFDSGLTLDLRRLTGSTRRVVTSLIVLGVPVTFGVAAGGAALFLGLSTGAAVMLGAILVVSGPTVVGPLLSFVRPSTRVQTILTWEGSVIDPVGAVLGALVFHAVVATDPRPFGYEIGFFFSSLGVGLAGGVVGVGVLWLLLRRFGLSEVLGTNGTLAVVVAVAAACDALRDDTGLIAAIVIGVALANLSRFDVPARRPFFETVIQLVIGLLFVSISATVTPDSVTDVLVPTLGLAAVLVVVARPLVALVATARTDLSGSERVFIGWMDPRGIVAAATASTFSATLVDEGVGGASDILPVTFLVIVGTVTLYGLTAVPVARRLGVARPAQSRPLVVGGTGWVVAVARALQAHGVSVLMWAGAQKERRRIEQAGLELAPGRLVADATGRGVELEGITMVLLLTDQDDFNALAAVALEGMLDDGVYRVMAPRHNIGVVAPFTRGELLFGPHLTGCELARRHRAGAQIMVHPRVDGVPDGAEPLFVVRADGRLVPVTARGRPEPEEGDALVVLGPTPRLPRGAGSADRARRAGRAPAR